MRRVLFVCVIGVSALVACGLSVVGTGSATTGDGGADAIAPIPPMPGDGDGGQGDAGCPTACDGVCSDLTTDPSNCGACGAPCNAGEECNAGKCRPACTLGQTRCGDACVDLTNDPSHCGTCTTVCPVTTPLCSASACVNNCAAGQVICLVGDSGVAGACTDTTKDPKNCGGCNAACKTSEICVGSACKPLCGAGAVVGDTFTQGMVGCVGHVTWENRATLCPAGAHVCSAQEWRTNRGTAPPTYIYWTNDNLRYEGSSSACAATLSTNYGTAGCGYNGTAEPMRVCSGSTDKAGNQCNWTQCGYDQTSTNEWFGGCRGNFYAGALCCSP